MPSTYRCEQGFSSLVEIKLKNRNSIQDVDTLMKGALETKLTPLFHNQLIKFGNNRIKYCMWFCFYADIVHDFSVTILFFLSLKLLQCCTSMHDLEKECTCFQTKLKGYTIVKKVDNHWVSLLSSAYFAHNNDK